MFDFIDCCVFIVYLYDTCLIRPEKIFRVGIKSNKLYQVRKLQKKMRKIEEKINKHKISPSARGLGPQLPHHLSYIIPGGGGGGGHLNVT